MKPSGEISVRDLLPVKLIRKSALLGLTTSAENTPTFPVPKMPSNAVLILGIVFAALIAVPDPFKAGVIVARLTSPEPES